MKLFIPELGTKLVLEEDWTFDLYTESRNEALYLAAGWRYYDAQGNHMTDEKYQKLGWTKVNPGYRHSDWHKAQALPKGTGLTVDRIYIRKGAGDYSSISFNLDRKTIDPDFSSFAKNLKEGKGRCRFWAKLDCVNKLSFEI